MKILESRILWGGLLVLAGVLFLLQNLGIFRVADLFWVVLLALAGVFFLTVFLQNRSNWWALIPGLTLFSVGIIAMLNWIVPNHLERLNGVIILGGIGLSFALIYLFAQQDWWAIIPAGVLFTLAAIAGLEDIFPALGTAGIFFLGLGLTFALVALLPHPQGGLRPADMRWAWIPAGILLIIGSIFLVAGENLLVYVWPVVLILAGGFFIMRALRSR